MAVVELDMMQTDVDLETTWTADGRCHAMHTPRVMLSGGHQLP